MKHLVLVFLQFISTLSCVLAQSNETGLPFIQNFAPSQYKGNSQNWAVVQDQRGVMYFGNNKGVLEYDGVNWRLIPISNRSGVRSLAIDSAGTIYVGATGEFGYLAPDKTGLLVYHSLVPENDTQEPDFTDVWTTLVKGDEVYFQSYNVLFRYKEGELKSWGLNNSYHRVFLIYDKLYLRQDGKGLMVMEGDSFREVPNGEVFTKEVISAMLPYNGNILIGSRNQGLFLYELSSGSITPFMAEASRFLGENLLYHGVVLPNGNLAFSTIKDGLIVLNREGDRLLHLNKSSGLLDKIVFYLYPDQAGALWLGLANGIARVEVGSPIRVFDELSGLEGGVLGAVRFEGTLYISNHQGVFYLNEEGQFIQVKDLYAQCWEMKIFNVPGKPGEQKLLVVNSFGLFEVDKGEVKQIRSGKSFDLKVSALDSSRIFIGQDGTLSSIRYENGEWVEEKSLQIVQGEFRSVEEDEEGMLWMSTMYNGMFRLSVKEWEAYVAGGNPSIIDAVKKFGTAEGLPGMNWNILTKVNHKLFVCSTKGIYRFDRITDKFVKDEIINRAAGYDDWWVYYLEEDEKGNLWFDSNQGKGVLIKSGTGYILGENALKRINISQEIDIAGLADTNGVFWFGTENGLYRYDGKQERAQDKSLTTLLRKVTIGEDSVIFYGSHPETAKGMESGSAKREAALPAESGVQTVLPYSSNSLSFQFATPEYELDRAKRYSYFLEGYDPGWSSWTKETKKEYTNLPEGNYIFKVKGKNIYDREMPEASFKFAVLPPWYRTHQAYAAFFFLLGGIVFLSAKGYSLRLKKDNQRLESVIKSRTLEIENQKNQIEKSYRNVTTLSQIGQSITATLDLKSIIITLYQSTKALMDVSSFGVGIYDEQSQSIHFEGVYEDGKELPAFSNHLSDENRLSVWCFKNQKEVMINDREKEYEKYLPHLDLPSEGKHSESVIYLPLRIKEKMIGVITVQSFNKKAYQPYHLDILRTLATYTAIALDNSYAYLQVNDVNEELSTTLKHLKHTQSQLVQSEKMASLGQLTAGVAHEINNPINFVTAGIESLSDNYADLKELLYRLESLKEGEENIELLEEISRLKKELDLSYLLEETPQLLNSVKLGARRTAEIVKSLKSFSRLDEDNLKFADIHEGIDSTIVILRNQLTEKTKIVREYDQSLPLLACFPGQLNQVFMNILSNAIQAIEEEGEIIISTAVEKGQVVIQIKDTGKGMSSDVKNRIFDPFFTTKEVGSGTGLGLSISYSIIEKHKGRIEVNSSEGQGTEFILFLPLETE